MRLPIEKAILATFLYRDLLSEKDYDLIFDYKIPYNLFKANRTHKLIAKAIFNLSNDDMPYDEITVLNFVSKQISINEVEWLDVLSANPITFHTMKGYVRQLEEINHADYIRSVR
jgi:hypothetical protein